VFSGFEARSMPMVTRERVSLIDTFQKCVDDLRFRRHVLEKPDPPTVGRSPAVHLVVVPAQRVGVWLQLGPVRHGHFRAMQRVVGTAVAEVFP
jgi:hypothetical protein